MDARPEWIDVPQPDLTDTLDLAFKEITDHLEAGNLRHHIGVEDAFEDVPQAHLDLEMALIYGVVAVVINNGLA